MSQERKEPARLIWLLILVAGSAVVMIVPGDRITGSQAGGFTPAESRKPMPALVMKTLDGGEWRLRDHRGEVVLMNYWATWCAPCREELPGLAALTQEPQNKGLAVVGVSMDQGSRAEVKSFVEHYKLPYPIVFPDAMSNTEASSVGLPTTVLIDRSGRIAKTYSGAVKRGDFESDVKAMLSESSP